MDNELIKGMLAFAFLCIVGGVIWGLPSPRGGRRGSSGSGVGIDFLGISGEGGDSGGGDGD